MNCEHHSVESNNCVILGRACRPPECSDLKRLEKNVRHFEQLYVDSEKAKNNAYSERNKLVAVLSKLYPSYLAKHDKLDESWDRDWLNIVVIEIPYGQCSWHIHDSELALFSHLRLNPDYKWDGHTTEEKYERLAKIITKVESSP